LSTCSRQSDTQNTRGPARRAQQCEGGAGASAAVVTAVQRCIYHHLLNECVVVEESIGHSHDYRSIAGDNTPNLTGNQFQREASRRLLV
jgi:hypothetical protein